MTRKQSKLVAEHDKILEILREEWMNAPASRKEGWMEKINAALEERTLLTALRERKSLD